MLGLNVGQEVLEKIAKRYDRTSSGRRTVQVRTKFFDAVSGRRTLDACKHHTGFMRIGPRTAIRFELNPARLEAGLIVTGMSWVSAERCLLSCDSCGFAAKYNQRQLRKADRYYKVRLFNDIKKAELEGGKSESDAKMVAAAAVAAEEAGGGRTAMCPKCDALLLNKRRLHTVLHPTGAINDDPLAEDEASGKSLLDDAELGDPLPKVWALYALGTAPVVWNPVSEDETKVQSMSAAKGVSVLPYALAYEASKAGMGGIRKIVVQAPENGICGEVERDMLELDVSESKQRLGFQFRVFNRK